MRRVLYWCALIANAVFALYFAFMSWLLVERWQMPTGDDWFWVGVVVLPFLTLATLIWPPRRALESSNKKR